MDVKKSLIDMIQTAQGIAWDTKYIAREAWEKLSNSKILKFGLGVTAGGAAAFTAWEMLAPDNAVAQESEDTCYPADADAALISTINRVMESKPKQYSFKLKVKTGETITDAINGYATAFHNGGDLFINDAIFFLTALGYDLNKEKTTECFVPICYSGQGCDSQELIQRLNQGPVIAEAAPPTQPPTHIHLEETEAASPEAGITLENSPPIVSAGPDIEGIVNNEITIKAKGTDSDGDEIKYNWKLSSWPKKSEAALTGADTEIVSFTPDLPGRYLLEVTGNDGNGGIKNDYVLIIVKKAKGGEQEGLNPMKYGMGPASIFNMGLGIPIGLNGGELADNAFHLEAGYSFGMAKRIDNDNITIMDPMTGAVLQTIPLEKVLETDISGYYANAFAKVGDMTLLSFTFMNQTQDGNFSIEAPGIANPSQGNNVSDYTRNDFSVQFGVRRGIYEWPGKAFISGDLFLGYEGMNDEARDDYGRTTSSTEMPGIGGGPNAAFRLSMGDFEMVPGLGMAYHYFSGNHGDMRSLLVTKAGIYDIRWNEFFGMGFDYTFEMGKGVISDKELKTNEELHRFAMQMNFGGKRLIGAGFGYTTGMYDENLPGDVLSRDADVTGFDAELSGQIPLNWGSVGLRAKYEMRKLDFNDGLGELEESIGSAGVFVEF